MFSPRSKLNPPRDYGFPYDPYPNQEDFMRSLYEILENKQIGIFESPTGTGKSLTLTCGALKWLIDRENLVKDDIQQRIDDLSQEIRKLDLEASQSKDWIETQSTSIEKKQEMTNFVKIKNTIEKFEKAIRDMKQRKAQEKTYKLHRPPKNNDPNLEEPFMETADDYDEEEETEIVNDENPLNDIKILFCSRTHSQLSQVVAEIKKTVYGKQVRCVSLASRQNLCINSDVKKLQTSAAINERCLEMQRSASKVTVQDSDGKCTKKSRLESGQSKCPFKTGKGIDSVRDSSLVEIHDIEELVTAGEKQKSCPYYATRAAAKSAQIIMLPYQLLLHRRTRLQAGIAIENSIIIIDEAHNLLDTISSVYSSEVSLYQLTTLLEQMMGYKMKYSPRFSTQNLLKINQMIYITKRLVKILTKDNIRVDEPKILRTYELMEEADFFNINLFHILEFCEETRFAQKLQGFARKAGGAEDQTKENEAPRSATTELLRKLENTPQKSSKKNNEEKKEVVEIEKKVNQSSSPSMLRPLLAFLESLTECNKDGGVILTRNADPKLSTLKFILLNPSAHFEDIVQKARSVIVAGGTMRPTEELTELLFKSCPERVHVKIYDHVVSDNAVAPFVIQNGPTGKRFLFNYANRNNVEMLTELGRTLQNICNVVPAGIVCFLSSYEFLDIIFQHFTKDMLLSKIAQKKHIFRETRGQTAEKLLAEYAASIKDTTRNGALLFSVVGGKLSEGLNFRDDLGRCVIVVGLPYANKNSHELQERMKHLEATLGAGAGIEYYENLCMKSVNQCIGRSIRHIRDYASVLLIDERFVNERVTKKLPQWISRNLKTLSYGLLIKGLATFFVQKRKEGV